MITYVYTMDPKTCTYFSYVPVACSACKPCYLSVSHEKDADFSNDLAKDKADLQNTTLVP